MDEISLHVILMKVKGQHPSLLREEGPRNSCQRLCSDLTLWFFPRTGVDSHVLSTGPNQLRVSSYVNFCSRTKHKVVSALTLNPS